MVGDQPSEVSRKLAAILYADIHGYVRLMDLDEAGTVARLTRSRMFIRALVGDYGGTVVNTAGDGLVALFPGAGQAARFAIEMQRELTNESVWSGSQEALVYRIGITFGETIAGDDGVFGHNVNLAARIQTLATPGGICVSDAVYRQLRNDTELSFRPLGRHTLKNIGEYVEVFALDVDQGAISAEPLTLPAPQPERMVPDCSLAILPLRNVSGDPADAHLCQGVVADLISNLCRFRNLMVIARHSTFLVAANASSLREIGNQLGVRYLLSGRFRRAGMRIRFSVDLIEADTENTVWSERYDGSMGDILTFEDEITSTTAARLAIQIDLAERRRLLAQRQPNLHAYGLVLRGQELGLRFRPETNAHARRLYEQARALDPLYGRSYAAIARTFQAEWQYNWSNDPDGALNQALNFAKLAVQNDELDARGYSEMGLAHLYQKQHDEALAAYERALQLNPNDADLLAEMGDCLVYVRQAERAVGLLQKAIRLNPYHPDSYLWYLGDAYFHLGDYSATIATLKRMRDKSEGHRLLAASYALTGQQTEAEWHAQALMKVHPNFTIEQWRKVPPNKHPEDIDVFLEGMRKAGLR